MKLSPVIGLAVALVLVCYLAAARKKIIVAPSDLKDSVGDLSDYHADTSRARSIGQTPKYADSDTKGYLESHSSCDERPFRNRVDPSPVLDGVTKDGPDLIMSFHDGRKDIESLTLRLDVRRPDMGDANIYNTKGTPDSVSPVQKVRLTKDSPGFQLVSFNQASGKGNTPPWRYRFEDLASGEFILTLESIYEEQPYHPSNGDNGLLPPLHYWSRSTYVCRFGDLTACLPACTSPGGAAK